MTQTFDVVAIGHALVDILSHATEQDLKKHNLTKGSMELVEAKRATELLESLPVEVTRSGGSAANTATGIASLGGKAAFIGKVNDDKLGHIFREDLQTNNVHFPTTIVPETEPTGQSIVAITEDAERTMCTSLGAAPFISANDVDPSLIANTKILYIEGYLWDREDTKHTLERAMKIAKQQHKEIAFSLSDPFCVDRHREQFLELIQDYITILFCNEEEITSLLQTNDIEKAIHTIKDQCTLTAITRGAKGSTIVSQSETVHIKAPNNLNVVDTTGAGDLYASGFLYAFTQDYDLQTCGEIGTIAASEVIQHIGGRPNRNLSELVSNKEKKVV